MLDAYVLKLTGYIFTNESVQSVSYCLSVALPSVVTKGEAWLLTGMIQTWLLLDYRVQDEVIACECFTLHIPYHYMHTTNSE